ncbi:MAG TPA: hypothetical protein VHY84_07330 [Bryobacteraceae bacterium]|jgi:hypothetical protein|nr:hypothetical protein [Bryobacteraceae bacterium]
MSLVPNPGIRFNDCLFSEPVAVAGWIPPRCPGLFAILVNDPNWAPKAFQPLYFGEFGNNTPLQALPVDYPRLLAAAQGRTLLAAVLPMPFSTTAQRRDLRNELTSAYNPECQTGGSVLHQSELATRFGDLEKRHREQTDQVMVLLANINQSFLPPPETPRRRIGFMPQTEPAG